MLTAEQHRKLEQLKTEFGLSNYEALHILLQMEQNEALRNLTALLMVGDNPIRMAYQQFSQQDFSKMSEAIGNMISNIFKKVEVTKNKENPDSKEKP